MTLSVSPTTAVDGATVTYKSTVTPVSGTPSNLRLHMESTWYQDPNGCCSSPSVGACKPTSNCSADSRTGNAYWTFATLAAPVTISYTTLANTGHAVTLWIESDGTACSGTCPRSVTIPVPRVSASVAYTADHAPVMPGTVLHVTVHGSATAGPMPADVQGKLGSGLSAPTGISPSSAVYAPAPYNYIDDNTTLNRSAALTFDTTVTAAVGATITLTGSVFAVNSKYGSASSKVSIHVGASPTPKPTTGPTATPKPTVNPTARPTAQPTPQATPRPTPGPSAARASSTPSVAASTAAQSSGAADTSGAPATDPSDSPAASSSSVGDTAMAAGTPPAGTTAPADVAAVRAVASGGATEGSVPVDGAAALVAAGAVLALALRFFRLRR
jgi:hypothetical protein